MPKRSPKNPTAKERIHHAVYGLGTIIESDGERTTIHFDEHGQKKFVTSMLEVVPSPESPPATPPTRRGRKSRHTPAPPDSH